MKRGIGIAKGEQLTISIPDRSSFNIRTPFGSSGLTAIDKRPGVVGLGVQQPCVSDLCAQYTTVGSTVRVIQETGSFTNEATTVAEGAAKPEAATSLAEVDFPVRKLAVFERITDELFSDYQRVAGFINDRLILKVKLREDAEVLAGDGTGTHLTGILNTAGIQTVARGTMTRADAAFHAMTLIRSVGFWEPTAYVFHPLDWEVIRTAKDAMNQYYGGGPFNYGPYGADTGIAPDMLWNKPVIKTTGITQGTALCGAFNVGCEVYRRMGLTVMMSREDGSNFTSNLITLLVEERLASAVVLPLAFCQLTGF